MCIYIAKCVYVPVFLSPSLHWLYFEMFVFQNQLFISQPTDWCDWLTFDVHAMLRKYIISLTQHCCLIFSIFKWQWNSFFFFFSAVCFTRLGLLLGSRVLYQWRQMSKQSAFSTFFSFPFLLIRYKAALRAYPPLGNLQVSHSFTHKWWTISWH